MQAEQKLRERYGGILPKKPSLIKVNSDANITAHSHGATQACNGGVGLFHQHQLALGLSDPHSTARGALRLDQHPFHTSILPTPTLHLPIHTHTRTPNTHPPTHPPPWLQRERKLFDSADWALAKGNDLRQGEALPPARLQPPATPTIARRPSLLAQS
jgi:hypothetical protein